MKIYGMKMCNSKDKKADIDCQLEAMSCFGADLPYLEKKIIGLKKRLKYIVKTGNKIIKDPSILYRKKSSLLHRQKQTSPIIDSTGKNDRHVKKVKTTLKLKQGEKVRIKPYEEILATLDETGRYDGLAYMSSVMNKYCTGTYEVRKRVKYFFDEGNWKMSKVRDVVILEGVYCESALDDRQDWAGCDRTCFLFWKEAWLERISEK